MRIERIWAMPSKWTFSIPPIKRLIEEEMSICINTVDPFSGKHSLALVKNDLDPDSNAEFHMDALSFLCRQPSQEYLGAFFDPPYSIRQAQECYKSFGKDKLEITPNSMKYWAQIKNELGRVLRKNGKIMCCGWSSQGLGKSRGFEMTRILMVPHGGNRNDTLVTIERKIH